MKPLYGFLNTGLRKEYERNPHSLFIMRCGYANGYVAVPPEHPAYGRNYEDVEVDIHGGLTFGVKKSSIVNPEWWNDVEPLGFDAVSQIPDDYWIFGFDTFHYQDGPHLNRDWCVKEVGYLKEQLEMME